MTRYAPTWLIAVVLRAALPGACQAQRPGSGTQLSSPPVPRVEDQLEATPSEFQASELEVGIQLTRSSHFADAIPHLKRVVDSGVGGYAASFDLALCYVGTGQPGNALVQLRGLQEQGTHTAAISNLIAQAYLGQGQLQPAWQAILEAARLAPTDEHMYALLADACTDHYAYALGLKVAELGLHALPRSARLHYERAVFLARLDRFAEARPEFVTAAGIGADTDIGYLARVQASLYDDQFDTAASTARNAIAAGHRSGPMLTLLGSVLLQGGAVPGQPGFEEARKALEAAAIEDPSSSTAHISLGTLYLREGRIAEALPHLEAGRRMEPANTTVYMQLATAYRRLGRQDDAAACLQRMRELLKERDAAMAHTAQ